LKRFLIQNCPKACNYCRAALPETVRCVRDKDALPLVQSPGGLNKMFESIVNNPEFTKRCVLFTKPNTFCILSLALQRNVSTNICNTNVWATRGILMFQCPLPPSNSLSPRPCFPRRYSTTILSQPPKGPWILQFENFADPNMWPEVRLIHIATQKSGVKTQEIFLFSFTSRRI
jgi:hypothetical protein